MLNIPDCDLPVAFKNIESDISTMVNHKEARPTHLNAQLFKSVSYPYVIGI